MKLKVFIGVNTAWNFYNFRLGLINELIQSGYEVIAIGSYDMYADRLEAFGCKFISIPIDSNGKNPIKDLILIWRYFNIFRNERPFVFLGYTVKPNIYGSIAASILKIPVINNIAGLGTIFSVNNLLSKIVLSMYKVSLFKSFKVFFQNEEDREFFISLGIVKPHVTDTVPGSGVDLNRFAFTPLQFKKPLRFILASRLIWEKGVGEYFEAARIVKSKGFVADFCLLGFLDTDNPAAISRNVLDYWVSEGIINYLGFSDDVYKEIVKSDCVVLPSYYREGVPRVLLEAAAVGRPLITTNSVGCREVVEDNVNGYLVRPRDAKDLAEKIISMINLNDSERGNMGKQSHAIALRKFDEKIVINNYIKTLKELEGNCSL